MTIHVNIGEAKTRLSELVAAAVRGQDVVLDKAGEPQVRLVTVSSANAAEIERRASKRCAALGMFEHVVRDRDIDVQRIKSDDRWDEHYGRKFADID